MSKFGRNFVLTVSQEGAKDKVIQRPFTVEFNIERSSYAGANWAEFRIYNLNTDSRAALRRDYIQDSNRKSVLFLGGYGEDLSVCFTGAVIKGESYRQGTDFITTLLCGDGSLAIQNSDVNVSYNKGVSKLQIVEDIVKSLSKFGVSPGVIGKIDGSLLKGNSFQGSAVDILSSLTGGGFFIDNEKAYVLSTGEAIDGNVITIGSKSGLLGTPKRENTRTTFNILWDPRMFIGQLINLDSTTFPEVNGLHRVISLRHSGIISESVAGKAVTTVEVLHGDYDSIRIRNA